MDPGNRMGRTLFEKLWDAHTVARLDDGTDLVYIDRIFLHERTGSIALKSIESEGRDILNPEHVFCTLDHIVDTLPGRNDNTIMPGGTAFIRTTREAAQAAGIHFFDLGDPRQGIVHVVSAEQGIALPGVTLICPDSHTSTLGGLGALAWGIGSTEAEHALATKTLKLKKPKTMRVTFDGQPGPATYAKDMILHLIAKYGVAGASGHAVEFAGPAIEALAIEARFTLCNMAVEFSAFSGIIAPDGKTIDYVRGRPFAPEGENWDKAVAYWNSLKSDSDAVFDNELAVDAADISPMITWGTSPQHAVPVDGAVPDPAEDAVDENARPSMERALEYMGLQPGTPMQTLSIDAAFIGSCTNSRISDMRIAAEILKGRKVADGVKAIIVPGSSFVKAEAEKEGIDRIFKDAGFEWRESGCSMCFYAGGEAMGFQERVVSSTNRNFESRQGPKTRSHLASPAMVAASAVEGRIADPRKYL